MGKTADNGLKKLDVQNNNEESQFGEYSFPIPLMDDKKMYELFTGKYVGIIDDQIIAVDESLRNLQMKIRKVIPKGKECTIEFFEDEVSTYGIEI